MPTKKRIVERRFASRIPAEINCLINAEQQTLNLQSIDLSEKGLRCSLPSPIPLFTQVSFKLQLPAEKENTFTLNCQGTVVRCQQNAEDYEVAIFFTHLSKEEKALINKFIMHYENNP